jgi:hypothetical protein
MHEPTFLIWMRCRKQKNKNATGPESRSTALRVQQDVTSHPTVSASKCQRLHPNGQIICSSLCAQIPTYFPHRSTLWKYYLNYSNRKRKIIARLN